jgi:hypothetical protein
MRYAETIRLDPASGQPHTHTSFKSSKTVTNPTFIFAAIPAHAGPSILKVKLVLPMVYPEGLGNNE